MVQVYVGFGSNIDKYDSIRRGLVRLAEFYPELVMSAVYESIPFGFEAENFYNLVIGFTTADSVERVAENLKQIENDSGRHDGTGKKSVRTLDIDLLIYGDLVLQTDTIRVPREDIVNYSFVLKPLAEIAPEMRHPVTGCTYEQHWVEFSGSKDNLWKVELDLDTDLNVSD